MPNNLHDKAPGAQANDAEKHAARVAANLARVAAMARAQCPQLEEPYREAIAAHAEALSVERAELVELGQIPADRPTLPASAAAAAVHASCKTRIGEVASLAAAADPVDPAAAGRPYRSQAEGPYIDVPAQSADSLHLAADPAARTRLQAAQGSPAVPKWKAARRERRVAAAVLSKEDERLYRFPWMSPDDHERTDEELETLDLNRRVLLANTRHKDGSLLARLESVFAPREKQQFRCIRDDALFAATEWGRLWRADRLLAKLTLEACLGMRGDGTCLRDWHSQRARNMLAIVWMFYTCGSTRGADPGEFRVRGVSINWLCAMLATEGKAALHRNTLGGTHRSDSARNEDVGYLTALENARVITRMQYGDRWQNQKVQEYHLRVSTQSEQLTAMLTAEESRFREWMSVRWEKLSELEALHVLTSHAHKRFVRMRHADMLREIAGSLLDSSDAERAGATDPPF